MHTQDIDNLSKSSLVIRTISSISLILIIVIFFIGLATGYGLISYSGKNPINVLHFLSIGVLIPSVTLVLTFWAMIKNRKTHNDFLIHISPSFWLDKILEKFSVFKIKFKLKPLIWNWLIINRAQYLTISFLFGIAVALIFNVVSRDLAFGWSTTLDIGAKSFYDFLQVVSTPWSGFFHSGVPSMDLVQKSQYYRLGGELSKEYVSHAKLFGGWWQFLVFAILFWGILPRVFMLFFTNYFLSKTIDGSYLDILDSKLLLKNMNEPLVTTFSSEDGGEFNSAEYYKNTKNDILVKNSSVIGWGFDESELDVVLDSQDLDPSHIYLAGGNKTLKEDENIIHSIQDNPTLIVKSWEPPTVDFIDFIDELRVKVNSINILPIGTSKNLYKPNKKDVNIWSRKLDDYQNIWIIV